MNMTDTAVASSQAEPTTKPRKNGSTRAKQLTKMLSHRTGVTIEQMQLAFGWQPHSAWAALSGLRETGLEIDRTGSKHGAIYRIAADAADQ